VSLLCLSQKLVSATLLVQPGENYEIGVDGENLVVLCIKIQIQTKYIKYFQTFQVSPQSLSSSSMRDEEAMCKESLTDKENVEKKNRREVSKWVRRHGLKFGMAQDPYPLYEGWNFNSGNYLFTTHTI